MMKLLILFVLISPILAHPPNTLRDNEPEIGIFHYLKRRSICNTGCNTCNSCNSYSSCSSSCNQCVQNCCQSNCCQNNCNICSQNVCKQNTNCNNCCVTYCDNKPVNCTTPKPVITTPKPVITTPTRPDDKYNHTIIITPHHNNSVNNMVNVSSNIAHKITNTVNNYNKIHVPIIISNSNKMYISNSISSKRTQEGSTDRINDTLIQSTPAPDTKPETKMVVITIPYQGHYSYPITPLPCMKSGHYCAPQRSYWSGRICNSCSGYGHGGCLGSSWGQAGYGYQGLGSWSDYSSGYNYGGLSGCSYVSQSCDYCGGDFYNTYGVNDWQYSSCFGCFI